MTRNTLFLLLIILTSCDSNKENKTAKGKTIESDSSSRRTEALDEYFMDHEIKPAMIAYNINNDQTEVQLSAHKIKWIDREDETKVKIDDDLFTLKDKVTLNMVWDDMKDSVDFANNWDEMKLYSFDGREIIGMRMSFHPCTGLGCSVDYFILYDVKTKARNFFGQFRTNRKLALYNFRNDNNIDFVSKTFIGDPHGSTPVEFIYELFSIDRNGRFVQQKDTREQTYFIKHTTFPNDTAKNDVFEQRWVTQIRVGQ